MTLFKHWRFRFVPITFPKPQFNGMCLDIGCGDGEIKKQARSAGWQYVGCDIDLLRGGALVQADGINLPFKKNTFELVLLWQVFEHVSEPGMLLREIYRVLLPQQKGIIIGSVSYLEPMHDVTMYCGYSAQGISYLLKKNGFKEIQIKPGINAFALLLRGMLMRLLPKKIGEQLATIISMLCLMGMCYGILICRMIFSMLRRGRLTSDFHAACRYICETAPLDFAGHIRFIGIAEK